MPCQNKESNMATNKQRIGMQDNTNKGKVRQFILDQNTAFQKQINRPLVVIDLPAEKWIFTRGLFAALGKNIKEIHGLENSPNKKIYEAVFQNMPKPNKVMLWKDNVSEFIVRHAQNFEVNSVWADYCGNPAEYNKNRHKNKYSYRDIDAFVSFVAAQTKPALYYLTFSIMGAHITGGKEALMEALAPNAKDMPSAILTKINQKLWLAGVNDKVQRILKVVYRGGSSNTSHMITIGFAINFKPNQNFTTVDENWIGDLNKKEKKIKAKLAKQKIVTFAQIQKKAILLLLKSKKLDKYQIATALQIPTMKVSAIAAHITMGSYKFKRL